MSTLYIDRRNLSCRIENGALIFGENNQRYGIVPTAPLERIVFHCNVQIDTYTLAQLGQKGIGIILLTGRGHQPVLFLPAQHHDAKRRLAQYCLSQNPEYCRRVASVFLLQKLTAQRNCLQTSSEKTLSAAIDQQFTALIEQLRISHSIERMLGLEGQAAALYFKALSTQVPKELHFNGRNRRPPRDPLNAILSLTYTLLTCEAALAAQTAGLDSYVGFLHALEYGRHSLACDLIEALRPEADQFALRLFTDGTLTVEHFSTTSKGCLLDKTGRGLFYPAYEKSAPTWRSRLRKTAMDLATQLVEDVQTKNHLLD